MGFCFYRTGKSVKEEQKLRLCCLGQQSHQHFGVKLFKDSSSEHCSSNHTEQGLEHGSKAQDAVTSSHFNTW